MTTVCVTQTSQCVLQYKDDDDNHSYCGSVVSNASTVKLSNRSTTLQRQQLIMSNKKTVNEHWGPTLQSLLALSEAEATALVDQVVSVKSRGVDPEDPLVTELRTIAENTGFVHFISMYLDARKQKESENKRRRIDIDIESSSSALKQYSDGSFGSSFDSESKDSQGVSTLRPLWRKREISNVLGQSSVDKMSIPDHEDSLVVPIQTSLENKKNSEFVSNMYDTDRKEKEKGNKRQSVEDESSFSGPKQSFDGKSKADERDKNINDGSVAKNEEDSKKGCFEVQFKRSNDEQRFKYEQSRIEREKLELRRIDRELELRRIELELRRIERELELKRIELELSRFDWAKQKRSFASELLAQGNSISDVNTMINTIYGPN